MTTKRNDRTSALYRAARRYIPGGTQLFSKRPDLHAPGLWPAYYRKAKGSSVFDLDGNKYTDIGFMGIGSCLLGYAAPAVERAVITAVRSGSMSSLNCPEEVELARILCSLHPWASQVRYARTGGEAAAVAVRIARAYTGKDIVLFCGYHGWHDWYLAANLSAPSSLQDHLLAGFLTAGVPRALRHTSFPFRYNDLAGLRHLIERYRGRIAAVIMEPLRQVLPEPGFLPMVRKLTKKDGIVLIFDEITAGFRMTLGGAHLSLGIVPDMAVFGKGMSNGYPMAAVIGSRPVMDAANGCFISSTYWTERIGPAAALATIATMKRFAVPRRISAAGKRLGAELAGIAHRHAVPVSISGAIPSLVHVSFKEKGTTLKTLFCQEMLARGYLTSTAHYLSYAHTDRVIDAYLSAANNVFALLRRAIVSKRPQKFLKNRPATTGFHRLN